jgi:hypothetical protein
MRRVFVLLFNLGTDNEGIHTIQIGDRNKILMFESEDDATRYALLLEAQDFPAPSIEAMDADEIEDFCRSADYEWELIADGMLAIPPEQNAEQTDWSPEGKRSENDSEMSTSELERIRRHLEGLL